ncbi:hypothetical protein [Streptomyces sp. NPDC000405]|uniref:DUF7848 domain-containing protein n=1 Tax=Streptomyces sp. NPDC000405 TaxID=3161033 RepID=UPI00398D4002
MSPHTIVQLGDWVLSPEAAPQAPAVTHEIECTTCGTTSHAREDFGLARTWAFQHLTRNPSHTGYREIMHRFWRATRLR